MSKKFSKEERKAYYRKLRNDWREAKESADQDEISAIIKNHGLNISVSSFAFVMKQMEDQGLPGLPYIDMKTYKGWKKNGFQVKKGEHSKADGLVWMDHTTKTKKNEITGEEEEIETKLEFAFPKVYKLFHRTQVEAIV